MKPKNQSKQLKQVLSCLGGLRVGLFILCIPSILGAVEFVASWKDHTPVYAEPLLKGGETPVLCLSRYHPLKILSVVSDGWLQVQDHQGRIFWIDKQWTFEVRTLLLQEEVKVYEAPDSSSLPIFRASKNLALWLLSDIPQNGFLHVRHPEGLSGYLQVSGQVWGFEGG